MIGDRLRPHQVKEIREWVTLVILLLYAFSIALLNFDPAPLCHWWSVYPTTSFTLMTLVWMIGLTIYDAQEVERRMELRRMGKSINFSSPIFIMDTRVFTVKRPSRYARIDSKRWVV